MEINSTEGLNSDRIAAILTHLQPRLEAFHIEGMLGSDLRSGEAMLAEDYGADYAIWLLRQLDIEISRYLDARTGCPVFEYRSPPAARTHRTAFHFDKNSPVPPGNSAQYALN